MYYFWSTSDCFQLSTLTYKVANSPTLITALEDACECVKIKPKRLQKNVLTQWDSTSELARSGLYLRPALDKLVTMVEHNCTGTARLHQYYMDDKEWHVLNQLLPLLDVHYSILLIVPCLIIM
jgi:hypothetical protein